MPQQRWQGFMVIAGQPCLAGAVRQRSRCELR